MSTRSRSLAQPVMLGALGLTFLTLGLQYLQHVRESKLLNSGLRLDHATEFGAPTSSSSSSPQLGGPLGGGGGWLGGWGLGDVLHVGSGPPTGPAVPSGVEARAAMDSRLNKLERALAWLEAQPPLGLAQGLGPRGPPLKPGGLAAPEPAEPPAFPGWAAGSGPRGGPTGGLTGGGPAGGGPPGLGLALGMEPPLGMEPTAPGGGGLWPGSLASKERGSPPKIATKSTHKLRARDKQAREKERKGSGGRKREQPAAAAAAAASSVVAAGESAAGLAAALARASRPTESSVRSSVGGGNTTDAPVFLERILRTVGVDDITNYPAWYFGAKGARGYFEDGPWAAEADVNLTNENFCGRSRGKEGPWRALTKLQPSRGRRAVVATVSRCAICDFVGPWEGFGKPNLGHGGVVLIGGGNENWGMFSEHVPDRSVAWGAFAGKLRSCGKTPRDFHDFMDDPRIHLWVTNQHQALAAVHPKVLSLPLGMKNNPARIYAAMKKHAKTTKKKLLIINNSGWKHRTAVNELVAAKFAHLGVSGNTYAVGKDAPKVKKDYFEQLAETKFVLCPSGMGYDTYRHWEVLLMGAVPVFESSPGFDKTFAKLPALIVKSYRDITPELLESAYAGMVAEVDSNRFDFRRLTKKYWMDLVLGAAGDGSSALVAQNHPPDRGTFPPPYP